MRFVLLAAAVLATACGPQHCPDPNSCFKTVGQFSALTKLQVAANFVYFYEAAGFERVPVAGGTAETLLSDTTVRDFAVVTNFAFVATDTGLVRIDTGSGIGHTSLSSEKTLAVAADDTGVAWLTCTALNQAGLDGSQLRSTPVTECGASALTLDGSTVYGSDDVGLWYASRSGGAINRYSELQCSRMQPGGGWVYCLFNNGLIRVDPLQQVSEQVMDGNVHDFALSAQNIYAGVDTDLDAIPRNGGGPVIYGTIANITAVAVDSTSCYLVNSSADMGRLLSTPL
jgi:hypothetical protein